MKKTVSVVLSVIIVISSVTIGLGCITMNLRQNIKKRQLDDFWSQISEFDGEITNRLIVKSKKKIDYLNASCVASGYENTYFLQFDSERDVLSALDYYASADYVESVKRESAMQIDMSDDFLDTKCYATANSNIDDALKLINKYYNNLPEIKIGVIDTGAENNALFGDRLVGGYDSLPDEDCHGSYIVGTIFYNTPENVKIHSYKAGSGEYIGVEGAVTAINKAVSDGCKIINMSFGDEYGDISLYNAICTAYHKGVIFIASAGNDGQNLSIYNQYPAEYAEVLAIGNMSVSRSLASTSNYGTGVFTYATGTSVRSNYRGNDIYWSGTSAAAPIVASILADMLTVNQNLSVAEIKRYIANSEISPEEDNTSRNMIDAYGALKLLTGKALPCAELEYTVTENKETGCSNVSFSCDDDTRIYYYLSTSGSVVYPLNTSYFQYHNKYEKNTTISFDAKYILNVIAYSDNKAKSTLLHINAPDYDDKDYGYSSALKSINSCRLNQKKLVVPKTIDNKPVERISSFCFAGNKNAEIIILPDTIKQIDQYAFANCPNLKKVIAPKVTRCGRYAFANCYNLKQVIMPLDMCTYTGMFKNCSSLIIAQIGQKDYFTSYYNKAFVGCDNVVNYNSINCGFIFEQIKNGSLIYKYMDGNQSVVKSADEILFLWDSYYINRVPQKTGFEILGRFDSTAFFDVNSDGIVNAKDYAIIKATADCT